MNHEKYPPAESASGAENPLAKPGSVQNPEGVRTLNLRIDSPMHGFVSRDVTVVYRGKSETMQWNSRLVVVW